MQAGKTGEITNILYTGFRILRPSWWAVWIGPQQQQEPKSALGDKCALDWRVCALANLRLNNPADGLGTQYSCIVNIAFKTLIRASTWLRAWVPKFSCD